MKSNTNYSKDQPNIMRQPNTDKKSARMHNFTDNKQILIKNINLTQRYTNTSNYHTNETSPPYENEHTSFDTIDLNNTQISYHNKLSNQPYFQLECKEDSISPEYSDTSQYDTVLMSEGSSTPKPNSKSSFDIRQLAYEKIKLLNNRIAKQKISNVEMIECSFAPRLNNSSSNIRTADQFYTDQISHINKINGNKHSTRHNDITSQLILNTWRPSTNVAKTSNIKQTNRIHYAKEIPQGKPTINSKSQNIIRSQSIEQRLYSDAIRRRSPQAKQRPSSASAHHAYMSENSKLYYIKSIESQMSAVYKSLNKDDNVLNIGEVIIIMTKLGFYKNELALVNDAWIALRGEELKGVSSCNLLIFLLAIMNVFCPWMQKSCRERLKQQFVISEAVEPSFDGIDDSQVTYGIII